MEYDIVGHGLLTYVLLKEGIEGSRAKIKSKDLTEGFQELFDFSKKRIPEIRKELELEIFSTIRR
jgi:hypothetical protein